MNGQTKRFAVLTLGKVAERNPRIKANLAKVRIGFEYIEANKESYVSVTGEIWNGRGTDILRCGCGTQDYLHETFFRRNSLLKRICEIGHKYHLRFWSTLKEDEIAEILAVMESVDEAEKKRKERNGKTKRRVLVKN